MKHPIKLTLSLDDPLECYSIDESVEIIHQIHLQLESLEDYRLKLKWCMGQVLVHTHMPKGRRAQTVDEVGRRLRDECGISASKSLLYQCVKLYTALNGDYERFVSWIEMKKRTLGRPVYWYDVVNDLLGGKNNPAVIGREAADQADSRDAERAIEAIERIITRAVEGNDEASGVIEGIRQSILGLALLAGAVPLTPRSDEYLRFVALHGCLACGRPSEPHHAFGRRGTGVKPSDFGCVPLCRIHHRQMHESGVATFERFHDVFVAEAALNLLHKYVTGSWLTMQLTQVRDLT